MSDQRRDDLEEADRLMSAAQSISGKLRDELEAEATALRGKWQAPPEMLSLAETSMGVRESDLAEADRLSAVAETLRKGPGRSAVEAEAAALRAKWPDFSDDPEGQIMRLGAYLLARGISHPDMVPARAILSRLVALEAEVKRTPTSVSCHGCGLPISNSGPPVVNTALVSAVKHFEVDPAFRTQVVSGQVHPGQSTSPWIPGSPPHRGPGVGKSPCELPLLAQMIRHDPNALSAVGPKLRQAFYERGLSIDPPKPIDAPRLNGHAPH